MSESVVPDHAPFTPAELDAAFLKSPSEYWNWLTNLDWAKVRHAAPKDDVREEFADTLVYHEVLRELDMFLDKDKGNWPALKEAIIKAFGDHSSAGWEGEFLRWYNEYAKPKLRDPTALSKSEIVALLESMPLPTLEHVAKEYGEIKVGIVGGGVSGLYAGRLLDWLNEYLKTNPRTNDNGEALHFDFEILEAANRVGGRVYTHHFSPSPHDYYDVGAMRFPDTDIMKRTFNLFADVGLYKTEQEVEDAKCKLCKAVRENAKNLAEQGIQRPKGKDRKFCEDCKRNPRVLRGDRPTKLIKYLMNSVMTPDYFNDIQHYKIPHTTDDELNKKNRAEAEKEAEEKEKKMDNYSELKAEVEEARKKARKPDDNPDRSADIFCISTKNYGDVPYVYVSLGADKLLKYAYNPFKYLMRYNFHVGYQALMKYESYSVREFLSKICKFDFYTINWLETSDSATGWFDLALSEAVIESFTFDTPLVCTNTGEEGDSSHEHDETSPPADWYCVEGGTGEVIRRLNDKVSGEPEYNRVVIGMKLNRGETKKEKVEVYLKDESHNPRKYHTVINTTTLGCASRMDLKNVELQTGQKSAIRMLRYSASTKIGIKFTDPWWTQKPYSINRGGVAHSDLYSARMCVYPSYNISDPSNRPAVLLASYCWGQDAERVGAMIKKTSPEGEEILRDCLLRDLARLHHDPDAPKELKMGYEDVLSMLRRKYITHYSYDWNHDSFVSGAFAMFGPGQYRKMMPHLQRPTADSRLHFVGEATSNHHAWIVGALESALRAVCFLLIKTGHSDLIKKVFDAWDDLPGYDEKIFFWQYVLGLLPPNKQATGQGIVQPVKSDSISA